MGGWGSKSLIYVESLKSPDFKFFSFLGGGAFLSSNFLKGHDVSEASSASEPLCFIAKIDDRHNAKKEDYVTESLSET